ncbi:2-oxoglutarate dehydrogenase, E2 component, dihydrolipoamide succinyltransferase, partial [Streptomyces toxytricini]
HQVLPQQLDVVAVEAAAAERLQSRDAARAFGRAAGAVPGTGAGAYAPAPPPPAYGAPGMSGTYGAAVPAGPPAAAAPAPAPATAPTPAPERRTGFAPPA